MTNNSQVIEITVAFVFLIGEGLLPMISSSPKIAFLSNKTTYNTILIS